MFKQNRSACGKPRESTVQQIRPEPQLQIHPKISQALVVFTVIRRIRRHDPVIQNSDHIKSLSPAPHSPWWSIGPPIKNIKNKAWDKKPWITGWNGKWWTHTHAVTHTKHPPKKGAISESCHDLLLASLSLKAWRTGFKGLGGCLLSTHKRTHCPYLHIGVWNKVAVTSWSSRFLKILSFSRMAGEECLGPSSRWAEKLTSELLWTQADAMTQALIPQAVGNSMVWRVHVGWLVSSRLQMAASSLT